MNWKSWNLEAERTQSDISVFTLFPEPTCERNAGPSITRAAMEIEPPGFAIAVIGNKKIQDRREVFNTWHFCSTPFGVVLYIASLSADFIGGYLN
jgi:hypothetical protein